MYYLASGTLVLAIRNGELTLVKVRQDHRRPKGTVHFVTEKEAQRVLDTYRARGAFGMGHDFADWADVAQVTVS